MACDLRHNQERRAYLVERLDCGGEARIRDCAWRAPDDARRFVLGNDETAAFDDRFGAPPTIRAHTGEYGGDDVGAEDLGG
jgi:hypothetical protein